ncbi:MAG: GDSL-type esterase/lipase family protein [Lentisphaeraceae bacterium]|nr:GDSL-type esterase/lipase family protein [Lentisphaeraceae bacterium]
MCKKTILIFLCLSVNAFAGKFIDGIPSSLTANENEVDLKKAPKKDKPWLPAWGHFPKSPGAWYNIHKKYVKESKSRKLDVVFLGDSITMGWHQNKELFKKSFGKNAANFGIGGDSTRQILWRLDNGLLAQNKPKLFVLKIGTNNLYSDFNSGKDNEIAKGITQVVQKIQSKAPKAKILLLGILPRQNKYFSGRARRINKVISKLDNGESIRYLDMTKQFEVEFGTIKKELFSKDKLHLVTAGYETWAKTMLPLFNEMLK